MWCHREVFTVDDPTAQVCLFGISWSKILFNQRYSMPCVFPTLRSIAFIADNDLILKTTVWSNCMVVSGVLQEYWKEKWLGFIMSQMKSKAIKPFWESCWEKETELCMHKKVRRGKAKSNKSMIPHYHCGEGFFFLNLILWSFCSFLSTLTNAHLFLNMYWQWDTMLNFTQCTLEF